MKNKLVIWGANAENEKVLIALELQAEANKVLLYTFPEAIAAEDFVNKMMSDWRNGSAVAFPEGHTVLERELSVADSLLPDDLRVERGDLIQRAQTEWHFAVLSAKLHQAYQDELARFRDIVQGLSAYDGKVWDSLRSFWDKVQEQSRERNLYREHADNLRDNINGLFDDLKKLRASVQNEFTAASQKVFDEFSTALEDVEKRIAIGGSRLSSVFDDLKNMQRRYRDAKMSNEHRNQLWERLDGAFKAAKERKFGPGANEGSVAERHERRIEGLDDAIKRMSESIRRDEEELVFQRKKVASTEGQLEAQIRSAKIKMVEERLVSKREKLEEMTRTKADVLRQIGQTKDKEVKRQKFDAAKEAARSEIAANVRSKGGPRNTPPPAETEDTLFGAATTVLGDLLEEALDTMKAVGSVVGERVAETVNQMAETASEVVEILTKDRSETETPAAEEKAVIVEAAAAEVPEAVAAAETVVAEVPEAAAVETVVAEVPEAAAVETVVAEVPEAVVETVVAEVPEAAAVAETAATEVSEAVEKATETVA
jgi:conjugal transfer/entry exclusion protein